MYGGGNVGGFNIIQISGLSIPENNISSIRYPDVAGQVVTKCTPMERVITVMADVCDENNKKITNAARVFALPGVMHITSSGKTKKIKCRNMGFEPGIKKGSYIPFTVQFCADSPYFEDIYETVTDVCEREGKLSSPFILGCVFSKRHTKNNVINYGDVAIEPIFEITSEKGCVCPSGITIKNEKNKRQITLDTDISAGEVITVDVKKREVRSNLRGNIISCLKKDTSLSRFLLDVGISSIEITAPGLDGELTAICRYNNNYVSMVV